MRAEEMMKKYKSMKQELTVLEIRIHQFKGVDERDIIHTMLYSGHDDTERVQTSGTSDKTAMIATKYRQVMEQENDELFDFLWERYKHIREEIEFFEDTLKYLPDDMGNVILDLLNGASWDEVADQYAISTSSISRYKKKVMKQLNEAYRLRDMQTEAYMLS